MLDLLFGAALAALLVAIVFPLLASSPLSMRLAFTQAIIPPRRRRKRATRGIAPRAAWTANEFAFDRAIEAYEELIDRTAGRLP
jgi:hypothetical protein